MIEELFYRKYKNLKPIELTDCTLYIGIEPFKVTEAYIFIKQTYVKVTEVGDNRAQGSKETDRYYKGYFTVQANRDLSHESGEGNGLIGYRGNERYHLHDVTVVGSQYYLFSGILNARFRFMDYKITKTNR
ncbi:hypothetical protein NLX67_21250 [Domibacillus sp. A3M-37]|uniref:hypothetical protein n=1 Tax=Domibacillus sp. A3M-37 TaxID=2962037 RepID=UPI0020B85F68|nr:hypothetical protein [Domibacillus sp. A3M-37]MCP3764850.1 hypothetical protein [Domibacillus sp. A3M-37]